MQLRACWVGLCLLGAAAGAPAAPAATSPAWQLPDARMPQALNARCEVADGLGGDASLAQLQQANWETAQLPAEQPGHQGRLWTFGKRWYRFRVRSGEQPAHLALLLHTSGYPADFAAYRVSGADAYRYTRADMYLPQFRAGITLPLLLAPGQETTVYFHVVSRFVQPTLFTTDAYLAYHRQAEAPGLFLLTGYFGMLVIMVLYNTFLFAMLRDRSYLYYLVYLVCFGCFMLFESGVLGFWWASRVQFYYLYLANALVAVAFLAVMRFSETFLRVPERLPRWRWAFRVAYAANGVTLLLNLWCWGVAPLPFALYDPLEQTTTLYCVLLGLAASVAALRRGYRPARLFLLSFAVIIVSAVLFSLNVLHLVPPHPLMDNALYLGSALEFALLSLALGDRFKTVRQEKFRERERISRDLHDHVGAQMSSVLYGLALAERRAGMDHSPHSAAVRDQLADLQSEVRETIGQLRETIWALHQQSLTVQAFCDRIQQYMAKLNVDRHAPQFEIVCPLPPNMRLGAVQGLELFRIAQEALHNALKYAQSGHIRLLLMRDHGQIVLQVDDDGRGLPPTPPALPTTESGFGMRSMQRRAEAIGGSFAAMRRPEGGSRIEVRVVPEP